MIAGSIFYFLQSFALWVFQMVLFGHNIFRQAKIHLPKRFFISKMGFHFGIFTNWRKNSFAISFGIKIHLQSSLKKDTFMNHKTSKNSDKWKMIFGLGKVSEEEDISYFFVISIKYFSNWNFSAALSLEIDWFLNQFTDGKLQLIQVYLWKNSDLVKNVWHQFYKVHKKYVIEIFFSKWNPTWPDILMFSSHLV